MALVRRPPLPPTVDNLHKVERLFTLASPPMALALSWWQRLEVDGREHFPRTGPVLVLPNHVTYFDPFSIMVAVRRPVHFMAGEGLFQQRWAGLLARWAGAVPRKKRVADVLSVRQLARWAEVGGAVGLFPEGERSWDGRPLPLLPGIGRLIRAFGHPVVTARIVGGYRQNPRWGNQRRGRMRIELDPPQTWDRRADPAAIEATLVQRLTVPADAGRGWPMTGSRLAEGVENVLFRCPACDAPDALQGRGDQVRCGACGAGWRLDIEHALHPDHGGSPLALGERVAALRARAGQEPPGPDGTLLRSAPMVLLDISGEVSTEVARGPLVLEPDVLRVEGSDWRLPLEEVSTMHVFMQRRLMIRAGDRLWEAEIPTGSVVHWQWEVEARMEASQRR